MLLPIVENYGTANQNVENVLLIVTSLLPGARFIEVFINLSMFLESRNEKGLNFDWSRIL